MTPEAMKTNYHRILQSLFGPGEIYHRASDLIDRLNPHLPERTRVAQRPARRAAVAVEAGNLSEERRTYRRLLWKAARNDFARYRSAGRAAADLGRKLAALASESRS